MEEGLRWRVVGRVCGGVRWVWRGEVACIGAGVGRGEVVWGGGGGVGRGEVVCRGELDVAGKSRRLIFKERFLLSSVTACVSFI